MKIIYELICAIAVIGMIVGGIFLIIATIESSKYRQVDNLPIAGAMLLIAGVYYLIREKDRMED